MKNNLAGTYGLWKVEEDEVREVNRAQNTKGQEGHGEEGSLYSKSLKGFKQTMTFTLKNFPSCVKKDATGQEQKQGKQLRHHW